MKRYFRWLCPALFLLAAIAVIWFLHLFVEVDRTMTIISWDSSVQIMPDGTEQPFAFESYSNTTALTGTYRFTGTLSETSHAGSLLFETSGVSLSLSLDGDTIWQSQAGASSDAYSMAQATVPLPQYASGELSVTCEILDGTAAMFPPLIRFVPESLNLIESTAFANLAAFPSGAAALALVLVFGLFLLGITQGHPDWSLLPLMLSMFGTILFQLVQTEGFYFLPEMVNNVLSFQETGFVILLLLLLYLFLNRKHSFWKYLGILTAWSASAFLLCYLFSYFTDGHLAGYMQELFRQLQSGMFGGLFYWLTLWLTFSAAMISAYGIIRSFTEQRIQTQGLLLKNKMISENYQLLKDRVAKEAETRHELKHHLTALDCLCRKKDYSSMEELLSQLLREQGDQIQIHFTPNRTVDVILQDTVRKAREKQIHFSAAVQIPESLSIPETDLCTLLMNMLDNALEGAATVPAAENPYISIRIKIVNAYLAVRCENSFHSELKKDIHGNLVTTKEDTLSHGFGCRQMEAIAQKYQSMMRFDVLEEQVFLAETALLLPDEGL